jgi:hypothetical protein
MFCLFVFGVVDESDVVSCYLLFTHAYRRRRLSVSPVGIPGNTNLTNLSFGREYHALCTLKIPWQSLLRGGYWAPASVCKEKKGTLYMYTFSDKFIKNET